MWQKYIDHDINKRTVKLTIQENLFPLKIFEKNQ